MRTRKRWDEVLLDHFRCAGNLLTQTTFSSKTSSCSARTTSGSSNTSTPGLEYSLRQSSLADLSGKPTLPSSAISSNASSLATGSFYRTRPNLLFIRGRRSSEHFQQVVWFHPQLIQSFSVICDNAPIEPQSLGLINLPVEAMKQVDALRHLFPRSKNGLFVFFQKRSQYV